MTELAERKATWKQKLLREMSIYFARVLGKSRMQELFFGKKFAPA